MRTLLMPVLLLAASAAGQWQLQQSNSTASLRGIDSLGKGVAWASGSNGTVLHTVDGGVTWLLCAIPPGGEKLDFRGIQAFDAKTAIVMSSGKGDLSRLYKTADACQTWTLLFTNPDPDGFWDAINSPDGSSLMLLGDPVDGSFRVFDSSDGGLNWTKEETPPSLTGEGAFAASNTSLAVNWVDGPAIFGTGSPQGARLFLECETCTKQKWSAIPMPMFAKGDGAGIFSISQRDWKHLVAVGGDYKKPAETAGTAAFSNDSGKTWTAAATPPHGYRSAVACSPTQKAWITVGPNGTDISTDDGRNWRPLRPGPGDAPDADQHWNALSLPFVVGSHGRIGVLNPAAVTTH